MIIFDVLTDESPVGWKGERTRLFLTEAGYQKSLENQEKVRHLMGSTDIQSQHTNAYFHCRIIIASLPNFTQVS